jgi:hypothetical protein
LTSPELYTVKNDLKKFEGGSTLFMDIPPEVTKKTLLHSFSDLLMEDFVTIAKHDPLDIPTGIPLIDAEGETTEKSTDEEFEKRVFKNLDKDLLVEPELNELVSDQSDKDEKESGRVLRPQNKKVTFKQ